MTLQMNDDILAVAQRNLEKGDWDESVPDPSIQSLIAVGNEETAQKGEEYIRDRLNN